MHPDNHTAAARLPNPKTTEKGSVLLLTLFFMFVFLGVAALGVDVSRYLMKSKKVQAVADGAALAGGQAFNQFTYEADLDMVRRAMFKHIARMQGQDRLDFYSAQSPHWGDGYIIRALHPPSLNETCAPPGGSDCPPYPVGSYKVGILAVGQSELYFLPDVITGTQSYGIVKKSIALIEPQQVTSMDTATVTCGVYTNSSVFLPGNNFYAWKNKFCTNSSIDASGSNNGVMGEIYLPEDQTLLPPGGGTGEIHTIPEPQPLPNFLATNPAQYDVDLSDFESWTATGTCTGTNVKALRVQGGNVNTVEWSPSGDPVCLRKQGSDYVLQGNNLGTLQKADGTPISIYANGSFSFTGNSNTLNGGLYSTGSVVVSSNYNTFDGDPDTLGGLALWSEGLMDIQKNSTVIKGILGSNSDINFGNSGGGTGGPILEGVIISHNSLNINSNSNNTTIEFDPDAIDPSFFDTLAWGYNGHKVVNLPLYSSVRVKLLK